MEFYKQYSFRNMKILIKFQIKARYKLSSAHVHVHGVLKLNILIEHRLNIYDIIVFKSIKYRVHLALLCDS